MSTDFQLTSIGVVVSSRSEAEDDNWDSETSRIELLPPFEARSLQGLADFSHCIVVYIKPWMVEFGPRGDVVQPVWSSELMKDYW